MSNGFVLPTFVLFFCFFLSQIRLEDAVEEATGGKGSKAKLTQAVGQRWVTICFMLLRVLERWDPLGVVYMNCGKVFPLTGKRNEVRWEFSRVFL